LPRRDARVRRRDPPRALIVATRPLGLLCELVLRHCECVSTVAASAARAREHWAAGPPDILVVEAGPRGVANGDLLGLASPRSATVALTRAGDMRSLDAYREGADAVSGIPFTPDELAVRVYTMLRLVHRDAAFSRKLRIDAVELSLDETVRVDGSVTPLGPAKNSLLYYLAANHGRAIGRTDVRRDVWGASGMNDRTLDRRVAALSRLLGDGPIYDTDS